MRTKHLHARQAKHQSKSLKGDVSKDNTSKRVTKKKKIEKYKVENQYCDKLDLTERTNVYNRMNSQDILWELLMEW